MTTFEEAAAVPSDALTKFPIYQPRQRANVVVRQHNCPTCPDGGYVVPFNGDGRGNVTEYRCITCKTHFGRGDA
jgi:hypothetical protein